MGLWVRCMVGHLDINPESAYLLYVLLIGFKLNLNVAHLDNGLHKISWNNPFPGVFTFTVFLNNRQVFETETEDSYIPKRINGDVCVVAQDKQGNNWRECYSLEEPFEVAWASSGVLGQGQVITQ